MNDINLISLTYSDPELRKTQQKAEFTFEGVCSFIAYWAMEEGMKTGASKIIYESNKIQPDDQDRVRRVLDAFIRDARFERIQRDKPERYAHVL